MKFDLLVLSNISFQNQATRAIKNIKQRGLLLVHYITYGNHSNSILKRSLLIMVPVFVSVFAHVCFSMTNDNENHFDWSCRQVWAVLCDPLLCDLWYRTMSKVMVWKCVKKFQEGHLDVYDESHSDNLSVIMEEIVNTIESRIWKDHRVKISALCAHFPQVSHGTLFDIVKNCLDYGKLYARWMPRVIYRAFG